MTVVTASEHGASAGDGPGPAVGGARGPARLRDDLAASGALRSPRWLDAFGAVPRHVFVPRLFTPGRDGSSELVDGASPAQRDRWLDLVYRDEPLITEVDATGRWRSSSSQPRLMAMMLEALEITGTERVLEIGTGTGYNAALLCEGLGSGQVTSIDISPDLVAAARERLASLGYAPETSAGDGALGYPPRAPYDRIITTCSLPRVPAEWIRQCADGALILVSLYRALDGGPLAVLRVEDGQASGHFTPFYGGFMPTRLLAQPRAGELMRAHLGEDGDTRDAVLPDTPPGDDAFAMIAALRLPGVQRVILVPDDGPEQTWLVHGDGSWARRTAGSPAVVQGGPRRLWDELEEIHADWEQAGRPAREAYGLTVTADREHLLWHGTPAEGRLSI